MLEHPVTLLQGLSYLYWILAIGAFVFAIHAGKNRRRKLIGATCVVLLFGLMPGKALVEQHQRDAYAKEAWAYFKKMCAEKAGEKIYKTFTGVKSVVVIKPLPPATDADHFDQYWFGDPYSAPASNARGGHSAGKLVYPNAPIAMNKNGRGFDFVEVVGSESSGIPTVTIYRFSPNKRDYIAEQAEKAVSRFAISWDDISTYEDRKYWVAASKLTVLDLVEGTTVAERIGYFIESGFGSTNGGRRPWLASKERSTTCPYSHDWSDRWFLLKVLNPGENGDGK